MKDAYDCIKNDTHPNITTDQIKYGSYILAAWGKSEEVWISTHPEHYPVFKGLFGDYESYFDDASEAANYAIWNPTTFRWPTVSLQNSGTTASEVSLKKREQYNKDIIRLLKNKSIVVPHRYDDEKGILYIYEPVIDDREAVLGVMDRYFGQINEPMINK